VELDKHETCQQYVARRLSEGWKIVKRKGYEVTLQSPEGIKRLIDIRNDVETLRPNAEGDELNLSQFPFTGQNYQKVDEAVPDEDTTYVNQSFLSWERDLYNLPASSGSGTINDITVYIRCREYTIGYAKVVIKASGTVDEGDQESLTTSYVYYDETWNLNPDDSAAWEWADIDALQIGVSLKSDTGDYARCTQVYVEVDYTPPASSDAPSSSALQQLIAAGDLIWP
jgi:hypothetical protein